MKHKLMLQKQKAGGNAFGEVTQWETVKTLRASVQPISAKEFVSANQEHAQVTHKVTIRYDTNVRPSMRLLLGNRVLSILHIVDPWEQHREMTLMCKELI